MFKTTLSTISRLFASSFDPATYTPPQGVPSPTEEHTLELYKFDTCPYCRRVMRTLNDTGLMHRTTLHDVRKDTKAMKALLELTQNSQVPCLVISGTPLLESKDIKHWLLAYNYHHQDQHT